MSKDAKLENVYVGTSLISSTRYIIVQDHRLSMFIRFQCCIPSCIHGTSEAGCGCDIRYQYNTGLMEHRCYACNKYFPLLIDAGAYDAHGVVAVAVSTPRYMMEKAFEEHGKTCSRKENSSS